MVEPLRDASLGQRVLLHEARAQQAPGRELRNLGDAWLFHDPGDPEPFWNRVIGPRWPEHPAAFERRLDEVVTLFATLDRIAHIRPLPLGGRPDDLEDRLVRSGFDRIGADRRMVLVDREPARRIAAEPRSRLDGHLTLDRGPARSLAGEAWAGDAALVVGEAFGVDPFRRAALETDILSCMARRGCSVLVLRENGEPVAMSRRATVGNGSYLSSIGTRPRWRGRGYGSLVTALAVLEAIDAGSDLVHLAVDVGNPRGQAFYEALGFAVVGDPVPDLLMR